ncbi:MAG: hypothetical protein COX90_02405 [Candidatus Nealsonbacteria bacterium CG_4_10_14_0_2_um_filter_38_17]|uniref:LTD domain-containing protein n=2 Tax=Candidatus Nealsoniibacteriota TaxID=1817911 RepID=A0A2M7UY10_9BACT|nr:MAG: hypothetical protein COX90_02405 [Candidatus Nealsonbacteria bacterium CG_4_10_14_0_2_um_filter_38_17]
MKKYFLIIIFLFLFCLTPFKSSAANLDVVINEVAWMGTTNSANDEWFELYNNTQNPISLDGWQLISQDGTPKITLSGIIPANGFYLLERTNDDTVPGILADKIYTGALGNSGEYLKLYDNLNNIVDEVNCSEKWFAGDNKTKQTMERMNPLVNGSEAANWQTSPVGNSISNGASQNPGGTPKTKNSTPEILSQPTPTPTPIPTPTSGPTASPKPTPSSSPPPISTPTPTPKSTLTPQPSPSPSLTPKTEIKKSYPTGIIINEILASPEGPDEQEEWIEVFNQNNFEVNLSEWQIADAVGKTFTYTFPVGTKISAQGFLLLPRPETKITLNNDGDELDLLQPDTKIVDSVAFEKAPQNQSYSRKEKQWYWSFALTPGDINIITEKQKTESKEQGLSETSQPKNGEEKTKEFNKESLASLGEQLNQSRFTSKTIFIALTVAVLSAIIILFLKSKLTKNNSDL